MYARANKTQWEMTKSGCKVWDLKREYAWEILKELDPKLYTHYFRFNRTMEFVKDRRISPAHLLSWFGWRRLQTAYPYLDFGGRKIKEMDNVMLEQYTGKEVEFSPEEEEVRGEEELVEQPILELSLYRNPRRRRLH